jgi:NADH:ubiquinone oxidoreductase subunit C
MFGVTQKLKNDQRILLLDYSKDESPMIKEFPTEGYKDVYYSFFENQLIYLNNEFVEL